MTILDSNVVDVVGVDPTRKVAYLAISDHLQWSDPLDEHLWLLQEKINAYLRFIEGGDLYKAYPSAHDCKCTIELVAKYPLPKKALEFVERAALVIRGAGFDFAYRVQDDS
ncbi:DUF6572 domain-containing protein [Ralstonia pseudosolanacearum]|uniref:DUF6572 domain-containing protein n=1 Tax=Ralstonia pseudosolanacearum TaxID=1310165 RepID=UPI0022343779|nr:DUF6572 domain-containing protein [Ralstonia sp. RS642]UZF25312.1 hypothetical protein LGV80_01720 [Ralstonia sp. RS642]